MRSALRGFFTGDSLLRGLQRITGKLELFLSSIHCWINYVVLPTLAHKKLLKTPTLPRMDRILEELGTRLTQNRIAKALIHQLQLLLQIHPL